MRVEVVAVGTELLLGYVVDTNSAWIGEQLAAHGIDCLRATKVGDNLQRITAALAESVERADAVICCGGLGPTQDDITREAIAALMDVPLERDASVEQRIGEIFARWALPMTENNRRQADVPLGAAVIAQRRGTAPGLVCPVAARDGSARVLYAVPGVPGEMREMMGRAVLPALVARSGRRSRIASRTLRTWGLGESAVAEVLAPRLRALDATGNPAIAFLASGAEGIKVRITAKVDVPAPATPPMLDDGTAPPLTDTGTAPPLADGGAAALLDAGTVARLDAEAAALLDAEEGQVRALLGDRVFAVDEATMESVVGDLLVGAGRTLAVAESLTGGLIGARLTETAGASRWFRGGVVSYAGEVKRELLGVPGGPVVSAEAVSAMALGVTRVLGGDVGLAVTGVAGPDAQEGEPVGTVWVGCWLDGVGSTVKLSLPGGRSEVRAQTVISALDHLRRRLLGLPFTG